MPVDASLDPDLPSRRGLPVPEEGVGPGDRVVSEEKDTLGGRESNARVSGNRRSAASVEAEGMENERAGGARREADRGVVAGTVVDDDDLEWAARRRLQLECVQRAAQDRAAVARGDYDGNEGFHSPDIHPLLGDLPSRSRRRRVA